MIVGMKAKTVWHGDKVKAAAKRGTFNSLPHAGAALRLTARRSIRRSNRPSAPGQPPHTRLGALRNSIMYSVDKARQSVIIGPTTSMVGNVGKAHEFGGLYRGNMYDKRPFMGPALMKIKDRLPIFWSASVR